MGQPLGGNLPFQMDFFIKKIWEVASPLRENILITSQEFSIIFNELCSNCSLLIIFFRLARRNNLWRFSFSRDLNTITDWFLFQLRRLAVSRLCSASDIYHPVILSHFLNKSFDQIDQMVANRKFKVVKFVLSIIFSALDNLQIFDKASLRRSC